MWNKGGRICKRFLITFICHSLKFRKSADTLLNSIYICIILQPIRWCRTVGVWSFLKISFIFQAQASAWLNLRKIWSIPLREEIMGMLWIWSWVSTTNSSASVQITKCSFGIFIIMFRWTCILFQKIQYNNR